MSPATQTLQRVRTAAANRTPAASKYLIVSVINIVNHQVLLYVANSRWGWGGGWSNVFAAVIAAIPAYFLSRHWVWEVRGRHSLRSEVAPFWALSLAGLAVSTLLTEVAGRAFGAGLWVAMASLIGYGIVWVVKFAVLNGMFDRVRHHGSER